MGHCTSGWTPPPVVVDLYCVYEGGPIMGEKEAVGIRFGLHRAGFTPKSDFKSLKLLVGLEVISFRVQR